MVQIMYRWQPQLAAKILPDEAFVPTLGPQQPLSLIVASPALYGFEGCSCFSGYESIVTWDADGMVAQRWNTMRPHQLT